MTATLSAIAAVILGMLALIKVLPERSGLIVKYQGELLDDLQKECERLRKRVACLERRLRSVEGGS